MGASAIWMGGSPIQMGIPAIPLGGSPERSGILPRRLGASSSFLYGFANWVGP